MPTEVEEQIKHNIQAHEAVVDRYERRHGEIFNPIEQARLRTALTRAKEQLHGSPLTALDGGCGSGNLTAHLLALDFQVTSADVSPKFLRLVEDRFGDKGTLQTILLNGKDLSNIPDQTFDFAGVYSVLHHVPDYLALIDELIRVLKPGGVLYLDHERSSGFWQPSAEYQTFRNQAAPKRRRDWREYFVLSNYFNKVRKLLNHHFEPEGDIHVFADDHIEWANIEALLKQKNCSLLENSDYLLFESGMDEQRYHQEKDRLSDMHLLIAQKNKNVALK